MQDTEEAMITVMCSGTEAEGFLIDSKPQGNIIRCSVQDGWKI